MLFYASKTRNTTDKKRISLLSLKDTRRFENYPLWPEYKTDLDQYWKEYASDQWIHLNQSNIFEIIHFFS